MPKGEEMFKFHGFTGHCPKPPLSRPVKPTYEQLEAEIVELTDVLRSAHCIAERKGERTNWARFADRIKKLGIGSITSKVFVLLEGESNE
jgi:hypothetical protein